MDDAVTKFLGCDFPKRDQMPLRFGIYLRQPNSHVT